MIVRLPCPLDRMTQKIGLFRHASEDVPVGAFSREDLLDRLAKGAPAKVASVRVAGVGNTDGVKYHLQDDSWLLVWPSRTEPLLRIYAEARSWDQVKDTSR